MARSKSTMFTDTMIRKLRPEDKRYTRSEGNGFSLRVWPSGVKTWLYVFAFGEKRREMNLGSYPEVTLETARGKFEEARRKLRNGVDPMAEMESEAEELRVALTVAMLADEYIEKWAMPNKKSWKGDNRLLDVEVVPKWGKRKAKDVRRREVVLLLEGITGQRPGEVVTMHSGEIDGQWWTIADPKNGIAHRVFLTTTALDLIGGKTGYIFESPRTDRSTGKPKPMHVNALAHALRLNLEEPGETQEPEPQAEGVKETDGLRRKLIMPFWSPHDLRRTMATKLSELGFWDEIIDVVQNHKKRGIVRTYNRNRYDREKQEALEAWERKLLGIIGERDSGNVIAIAATRWKGKSVE